MPAINAVSFGSPNISPTYSGPSFFNSPSFHGHGLSSNTAENAPIAQVYSQQQMHEYQSHHYLASANPLDMLHEPVFTSGLSRSDSSASRAPRMTATLNRNWGWDSNEYTNFAADTIDEEPIVETPRLDQNSYATPYFSNTYVDTLPISSYGDSSDEFTSANLFGSAAHNSFDNDLVMPDPLEFGGEYEHLQQNEPYSNQSLESATLNVDDINAWSSMMPHFDSFQQPANPVSRRQFIGASDLRDHIRQTDEAERIQNQPEQSLGASELRDLFQRQVAEEQAQQRAMSIQSPQPNGLTRVGSFARDAYMHADSQYGAGLSSGSVRRNHSRMYSTGAIQRNNSFDQVSLTLNHGHEASSLLRTLRRTPQQGLYIRYAGEIGADAGGLTRQAFDKAYNQLLNKEDGLFTKNEHQEFELNESASSQDAKDFGLILGRIAKLDNGVGHDLGEDFFKKLHVVLPLAQDGAENADALLSNANKTSLINLLTTFDPSTFGSAASREMLNDMSTDDLSSYVNGSAKTFIEIALGFNAVRPRMMSTHEALMEQIGGPLNLRGALRDSSRFETIDRMRVEQPKVKRKRDFVKRLFGLKVAQPPGPRITNAEEAVTNWMKRAFDEASEADLKNASRQFTGGASFNPVTRPVIFNMRADSYAWNPDSMLKASTCFNTVEVNTPVVMRFIRNNEFDAFKSLMFSASSSFDQA
ncbi:MAG: hypothetical protein VX185_12000 [Pseudomonadota bacterium]|nr:hypothetical protein [Pseudomonadota bacterium]